MPLPPDANPQLARRLRLVPDGESGQPRMRPGDDARARSDQFRAERREHRAWEVGAENRAAAGLSSFDTRWVMAARVADSLEGGQAAILRPEVRSRLVSSAGRLGMRPFDANMVIAIVQDGARRGESPHDLGVADRLAIVGEPGRPERRHARLLLLSGVLALAWAAAIVRWLLV